MIRKNWSHDHQILTYQKNLWNPKSSKWNGRCDSNCFSTPPKSIYRFHGFFFYREIVISIFFRSGSKLLRNVILMIGYYSVNGVCSCCCCCGIIFLIVKKFFVDIWSFVVEKERKITTATFDLVQIFREIANTRLWIYRGWITYNLYKWLKHELIFFRYLW